MDRLHKWIDHQNFIIADFIFQEHTSVPQTPLVTSQVLKEETEQWPDVQEEMSTALKEMRFDPGKDMR